MPVDEIVRRRYPHFLEYSQDIAGLYDLYRTRKRVNNLMDFDDLLIYLIKLLDENETIRAEISDKWQHILVDEYQDTNRLQAQIVRLLAFRHSNVMAVGDDSQSIYSFRGADFTNIMQFPVVFPGTKVVKLEENYRSTQHILTVTNSIIEKASQGYPKRLFSMNNEGPRPLALRPWNERDQSRLVVKLVNFFSNNGSRLSDTAGTI